MTNTMWKCRWSPGMVRSSSASLFRAITRRVTRTPWSRRLSGCSPLSPVYNYKGSPLLFRRDVIKGRHGGEALGACRGQEGGIATDKGEQMPHHTADAER